MSHEEKLGPAGRTQPESAFLSRKDFITKAAVGTGTLAIGGAGVLAHSRRAFAARRATSELHLVCVNNITGSGAFYGLGTKRLEHILADKVNAAGGFKDKHGNTYTVKITDYDMGDSREEAVAAFRSAASDKSVVGVISPGSDLGWLSMLPLAGSLKMPLIIPSDGSAVTQWNPYSFRIDTDATHGFGAFLKTYGKRLGINKVALISDTEFPSVAFEGSLWRNSSNSKKYGYHLVSAQSFRTGDTDFSAQLTSIKASKPTWLMVVAQPPEMIKIVNQAAAMGIKAKIYGSFGSNDTTSVWQGTQGKVKGSYFYAPGVPTPGSMQDPTPYNLYKKQYKDVPIIFHIFGWDALNIAMDAVKRAGTSSDREKFRAALGSTTKFPLATSGTVTWRNPPTGENLTPPVVLGIVTGPGTAKIIPA